ncbi:hypothetical protein PG985_007467 [Apiospora marii]|uniref:Uncharacterized protein n=1 Tax=Apiospora marii TaxID=335849 RepID=A0ABR1SNH6_9PEZI
MAANSWFFCVPMAISGLVACGIMWLGLSHPEMIVKPDTERSDDIIYLLGRDPWAFPIAMAILGRFAVHILFEVKAAPDPPSSRADAKPPAQKEAYILSESQRLWAYRLKYLSAIIAVMVILCFGNLTTRFPPKTLERYVWVWAIFGPALPFLTLFFYIPYIEMSAWRQQRARLGIDNVDVENGFTDSRDEDEGDDGATADTEKQHAANNDGKGQGKRHEQNTSRYSNAEKEWMAIVIGLSTLISILGSTGFIIFFRDSAEQAMELSYMWIWCLFTPPFLTCWLLFFIIIRLEWSRWRRQRARPEVDHMDAENAYAAYTDDEDKVDEEESDL